MFKILSKVRINKKRLDNVKHAARVNDDIVKHSKYFIKDKVLYLGKSESDVLKRVRTHVKSGKKGITASLRISHPNRQHLFGHISEQMFFLKNEYHEYTAEILGIIERKLHDSFCPYVGSRR